MEHIIQELDTEQLSRLELLERNSWGNSEHSNRLNKQQQSYQIVKKWYNMAIN